MLKNLTNLVCLSLTILFPAFKTDFLNCNIVFLSSFPAYVDKRVAKRQI
jgi:hypothetical protein